MREAKLGAHHPDTAGTLANLAALLYEQKQYDDATPLFQRAYDIKLAALGENDPSTLRTQKWLVTSTKHQEREQQKKCIVCAVQ